MAFYGRVTNESKTSMTFDRVYPNRATMDASAKSDGVFSGRFVLVEYGTPIREARDGYYFSWYNDDTHSDIRVSDVTGGFIFFRLLQNTDGGLTGEKSGYNVLTQKRSATSTNPNENLATLGDIFKVVMCEQSTWAELFADLSAQDKTNPALVLEKYNQWYAENGLDTRYFMVVPSTEGTHKENGDFTFKDVTSFIDGENEAQNYEINYNIDKNIYNASGTFGRGYDSTVWRKVISNDGTAKYVMLAELNSVVPTFGIAVDAPTSEPIAPHFGQDASNVYYPLHVQSQWGFRIAKAENDAQSDFDVDDYKAYEVTQDSVMPKTVPGYTGGYKGAIYFNKDGFNPKESKSSEMDYTDNKITLEPVSSNQKRYETHDSNFSKTDAPDIQELKIIVPALGDAVNELYNKVAGEERKWNTLWADPNAEIDKSRSSSLRLIYDGADKGELDFDGAESLTGTINAAHDILGMIITKDKKPEDANLAYANQIYYEQDKNGEGHYYCTVPSIEYLDVDFEEGDYNLTPEEFAEKYQDRPILVEDLEAYGGDKFIQTDDTPTYELNKKDVGVPGATYYTIPAQLQFAGNMVASRSEQNYYAQSGNDYVIDSEGLYDIAKNSNKKEMYHILPSTEIFNPTTTYYTYSEITHAFTPTTVNSDNFNDKVAAGLYAEGEMQKQIISRSNTLYQVRYTNSAGITKMQPLSGLTLIITGASTEYYYNHLDSIVSFKNFIGQAMLQSGVVANDAQIDYEQLYIASNIKQDADGKYIITYTATPMNKFLFGGVNSTTNDYDNLYIKTPIAVEGKQVYNYIKANANSFNTEGTVYTCYKIMPIPVTVYEDNKYWRITVSADEENALREARDKNELTTINTNDYTISKIVKSRNGFVEDAIYWSIPEGANNKFTQVGYGINEKVSEMETTPGIVKYYTPNTLYYYDEPNNRYLLADDSYEFDPRTSELYRVNELFIKDTGDLINELKLYSRWNNNLIATTDDIAYYFQDHNVKLGYKAVSAEWKELDGFARDLNTIHGWIIKLNRLLNTSDVKTRDLNTIQGCINTINDIIEKFDDLVPGELVGVDKFGRIKSVDFNSEDEDGSWISVETSIDDETGKTTLNIAHSDPHEVAARTVSNLTPNFGDSFTIEDWRFDEKGHKAGFQTHTVSIPKGSLAQTASKNVVTSIAFTDTTGAIDVTRTDLKDIPLTSVTEGTLISTPEVGNSSTLGEALQSITNYYNAGATNIVLNNYEYTYTNTDSELSEPIDGGDNLNDAFKKLQWQIDNHKENQLAISGNGNVINALSANNGKITATSTTIGTLQLTGYDLGLNNTAETPIAASDTLNAAIARLEYRLNKEIIDRTANINSATAGSIESIKLNGTALTVSDKSVDIVLPVDDEISDTSTNPVQNAIVKTYGDSLIDGTHQVKSITPNITDNSINVATTAFVRNMVDTLGYKIRTYSDAYEEQKQWSANESFTITHIAQKINGVVATDIIAMYLDHPDFIINTASVTENDTNVIITLECSAVRDTSTLPGNIPYHITVLFKPIIEQSSSSSTTVVVDDAMSDTSTNPVQNAVIKAYIDNAIAAALATYPTVLGGITLPDDADGNNGDVYIMYEETTSGEDSGNPDVDGGGATPPVNPTPDPTPDPDTTDVEGQEGE